MIRNTLLAAACLLMCGTRLLAGLPGPPRSYILLADDGNHFVVVLSPAPVQNDRGNECQLPDGRVVQLRDTFAQSGLYEVGSNAPLWPIPWYERKGFVRLSHDGRFLIRMNEYGGGGYGQAPANNWAIKFYDQGVEVMSYEVNHLVDYPDLMLYTSSGWHYLWVDDARVEGERLNVLTTSRESYTFDVASGKIIREFRFWRNAARVSLGMVVTVVLGSGWWLMRWRRSPHLECPEAARPKHVFPRQFTIRWMFITTTLTAVMCAISLNWLHIGILLLAVGLAAGTTWILRRVRQAYRGKPLRSWATLVKSLAWSGTLIAWLLLYVLSFPAVVRVAPCAQDIRMVIAQVPYRPIYLATTSPTLRASAPMRLYAWYAQEWF